MDGWVVGRDYKSVQRNLEETIDIVTMLLVVMVSWMYTCSDLWNGLFFWASLVSQMVKCLPVMWETQVWSLGREDPLEMEMATHSSILACRILCIEEPGRLQSTGLQSQTWLSDFALFSWGPLSYLLCVWIVFSYSFPAFWVLVPLYLKVIYVLRFREGNGNPVQYFCLENPMDGGAW